MAEQENDVRAAGQDAAGPRPCALRMLASDEMGCFKVVEALSVGRIADAKVAVRHGELNKARAITAMSVAMRGNREGGLSDCFCVIARASGVIEIVNPTTGAATAVLPAAEAVERDARQIVALKALWPEEAVPTLASLTRGGLLRIHARGADEGDEWVQVSSSQVGTADSTCLDVSEDGETLRAAVGGRGAELRVLDALQGAESYRARGGRAHPQTGLMDPAWVSACAFVPGTECRKVVVGTGHYKLRLYDLDHGRRPRIEVPWEDARVTALGMSPDGQVCWVANGKGMVSRWDLTSGTVAVVLKGIAGSVRSVAVHPTLPLVATVGLDRFLRVHHLHTLKPLLKLYLKNQMTCVAWGPVSEEERALAEAEVTKLEAEAAEKEAAKKKAAAKRKADQDSDEEGGEAALRSSRVDDGGKRRHAVGKGGTRGRKKRRA